MRKLDRGEITEAVIQERLKQSIDDQLQLDGSGATVTDKEGGTTRSRKAENVEASVPVFLVPLYNLDDDQYDVRSSLFTFRPIFQIQTTIAP